MACRPTGRLPISSRNRVLGLTIHPQAAAKLERYDWPGNIRELQHTIEKAVILAEKNVIRAADLFIRPGKSVSFSDAPNLGEVERKTIEAAITQNDGNLTAAAEQLGAALFFRSAVFGEVKHRLIVFDGIEEQLDTAVTIRKTVRGLDTIKSQGQSLMNFTNSYRQLARLQAPNPNPFSLSRQVRNIELLFQSDLQRLQIGLTVYLCQDEITVNADEELLSQVLINLLKNAMEALEGQDNGEISLTVKQPGTTTLIEVTDNGPGIPHDMLEDIFIPFFTTKNKGTGIGLSLSRQIVRMHGGELLVSSQPYSETRFTLSLPNAGEFPPAK